MIKKKTMPQQKAKPRKKENNNAAAPVTPKPGKETEASMTMSSMLKESLTIK